MHSTTYRWPEGLLDPHHASRRRLVLLLGLVLSLLSCAKIMRPISYQAASTECQKPAQTIQKDFPLSAHLPMPIDVLAKKLRYEPFSIITAKFTKGGSTSAMRLKVQFRDCSVVQVKWRAAPKSLEAYNNSPRKELAAYAIQALFLEPKDYVVPVTVAACIPVEELAKTGAKATPQIAGTHCVLGTLAVWLTNVKVVDRMLDRQRFEQSVKQGELDGYARHFANVNLFAYLISHRDGRRGNFLISNQPQSSRVFAIDNGLAFSGLGNPRPFIPIWRRLKVDKFPRATIARLQKLTTEQLYRQLETVLEFALERDGRVRPATHFSANLNPHQGVRINAQMAQAGLTHKEIAKIEHRLRKFLQRLDRQEIQLF